MGRTPKSCQEGKAGLPLGRKRDRCDGTAAGALAANGNADGLSSSRATAKRNPRATLEDLSAKVRLLAADRRLMIEEMQLSRTKLLEAIKELYVKREAAAVNKEKETRADSQHTLVEPLSVSDVVTQSEESVGPAQ